MEKSPGSGLAKRSHANLAFNTYKYTLILMTNIRGLKICGLIPKWRIALSNCIGIICTQKHKPDNKNEYSKLIEIFERKSFPRICKSCSWKRHDVPSLCQCWAFLQCYTPSAHALGCAGLAEMATVLSESTGQALILFESSGALPQYKGRWKWQHSLKPGIWYKCDHFFSVPLLFVSWLCLLPARCIFHGAALH